MLLSSSNQSAPQDVFEFAMSNLECQLVGIFLYSVILTLGTFLVSVIISYIQDNQYATLLDYLVNASFLTLMFTNFSGCLLWVLRSSFSHLPLVVCQAFGITDSASWFMLTLLLNEMLLMKVLYVTYWKSVGQLNDDIFFAFFKAVNTTFVILHAISQIQYDHFIPDVMLFCTGHVEDYHLKRHFNNYFGMCSVAFWIFAVTRIWYEAQRVTSNGFRSPQGFEALYGTMKFLAALGISSIPSLLAYHFLEEGSLDQLPQALTIPLASTLPRMVMTIGFPVIIIGQNNTLKNLTKKRLRTLKIVCQRDQVIIPNL